jgi:hypothetical protein
MAARVLEGEVPYVDFIETNPPLIIYLNIVPAYLAGLLGMGKILAFTLGVHFLAVLTTCELAYLLSKLRPQLGFSERCVVLFWWLVGSLAVYVLGDFGQRDHLFIMLYLPFALARLARMQGRRLPLGFACLMGIQAFLGVCLKPHFCAVAVAVEAFQLVRTRQFRALWSPETVSFLILAIAYAAHWGFVPAPMREQYFHRWVPLFWRYYEATYAEPGFWSLVGFVVSNGLTISFILLLNVAVWVVIRLKFPGRDLLEICVLISGLALLLYIGQRKGWLYHLIPFLMATLWTVGLLTAEMRSLIRRYRPVRSLGLDVLVFPFNLGAVLLVPLSALVLLGAVRIPDPYDRLNDLRRVIADNSKEGDRILVVSTAVGPAYPLLVQMNRRVAGRYQWMPSLAFFSRTSPFRQAIARPSGPPRPDEEESRFLGDLREDIRKFRPKLVLVNDPPENQGCPPGFSTYGYMQRSGVADEWERSYRQVPCTDWCRAYVLKE